MDRDRLKQVHQTDLTESRVNEEFVDWLKNKGPSWLLVLLVMVCVYLAVVRRRQHRVDYKNEAWAAFYAADLPGAFEDVANDYEDVGQLPSLARIQAAERLLRSVQAGTTLAAVGADPTAPPGGEEVLTPELRDQYLTRAERLYESVIASDTSELDSTLFVVNALNGRAAIAECRGEAEGAKTWYLQAAERAQLFYPELAQQARARAESAGGLAGLTTFRTQEEINRLRPTPAPPTRVPIDPALRELIAPEESEG